MSSMTNRSRARKSVKKGVQFTLMVCGASGTGRTTFVNTLCESAVLPHREVIDPAHAHVETPTSIKPVSVDLEEDGVRIALTVVDTPGFGDSTDNSDAFQEILSYLERQYDDVLAEESRIRRTKFRDNRVHALLYFITPTGHSLRELDIALMRRLAPRVNVIPVIGRADSLTPSELVDFKKRIMEDIEYYQIPIYNMPYDVGEDDPETIAENRVLRALMPFAVIGSEEEMEIQGEMVRVRRYPWGVVEVDNPDVCDFTVLRQTLLSTHLTDLKEMTHEYLYEVYRTEKLSSSSSYDRESTLLPSEMANQTITLKEEQLKREEEKLREVELRVQREIAEKRQELLAKEESLRHLEERLQVQSSAVSEFGQ